MDGQEQTRQGGQRRVAVLPGDDAAPEAVYPALELLQTMGLPIEWEVLPDGETLARTMTPAEREQLVRRAADRCDTLLFGATSGKTGGVGYLRWGRQTFANVRPIRWRPGFNSPLREPQGIDYVIVRENLEDLYLGLEGQLRDLAATGVDLKAWGGAFDFAPSGDGRYALKVITVESTGRLAHFACRLALERREEGRPGKVTVSAKYNVLRQSDGLFRETARSVVSQYPGLAYEEFIVDDLARRLVAGPEQFDVIVLPNLYGDILSDVGAATIGGLGLAPSGCFGSDYAYFEPVHGTAPDIAGRHIINPTATMLSAAMMLDYLGFAEAARRLEDAVEGTFAAGDRLTPDQGGSATTEEFSRAVRSRL